MTHAAPIRPDLPRRAARDVGVLAPVRAIMIAAMTITMTTSGTRGQVGVD